MKFQELLTRLRNNTQRAGYNEQDLKKISKELGKRGIRVSIQGLQTIEDSGKEGDKKTPMRQFLTRLIRITEQMAVPDTAAGQIKEGNNPFLHLKAPEQLIKKKKIITNDNVLALGKKLKTIYENHVVA